MALEHGEGFLVSVGLDVAGIPIVAELAFAAGTPNAVTVALDGQSLLRIRSRAPARAF